MNSEKMNIHIPKIDIHYWLLIILATTIGETFGNLISRNLELGYTTGSFILISCYILLMVTVVLSEKINAEMYWALIVIGNIAGTNCADFITIEPLNLGTILGSFLVMGMLTSIVVLWRLLDPKSSIENGLSKMAFFLYWGAILVSSTFGTTSGDFLSNDTSLGAGGGTILLIIILVILALLNAYTKISKEILYWIALVIMHPIGATIANYISRPSGLGFGNIWTSIGLAVAIFILFTIQKKTEK